MKSLYMTMFENILESEINCFLCKCQYGYKEVADKNDAKPEYPFQNGIKECLEKKGYKVEKSYKIDVDKLKNVAPTLNENIWLVDLKVSKEELTCFIEVKYDEIYDETSTNPHSEDEVKRDIYKLQSLKHTYPKAMFLIVFATNQKSHWKEFVRIQAGKQTIAYNNDTETFKLLDAYSIEWKEPMTFCQKGYKYCIIKV